MPTENQSNIDVDTTEFYESIPMASSHFAYRDDTIEMPETHVRTNKQDEFKTTAIVTLVLVTVTAVALGLIVWNGLGTLGIDSSQAANAIK